MSIQNNRIVGLDILRSIAILLVLLVHSSYLLPHSLYVLQLTYLPRIDGVSIFFVLSGFLIGGILLKEVKGNEEFSFIQLKKFWIRRWFRTVPNYMLTMLLLIAFTILNSQELTTFSVKYLFFLQNFAKPQSYFFLESWSLTIEEWFYLLFPMLVYFINKINKNISKSLLISAVIFLVVPLILRIIKFECGIGIDDYDMEFRKVLIFRLDSLMYGIIGAYVYGNYSKIWEKAKIWGLIGGLLIIVLLKINPSDWINFYKPLIFNYESIATLLLLPYLSRLKSTNSRTIDSIFSIVSVLSYSMYLINFSLVQQSIIPQINSIFNFLEISYLDNYVTNYILFWILTVGLSYFIYCYFEKPTTQLRERFS